MDIRINDHTAVIFDLDDTIYNEFEFLKSGFTNIAVNLAPERWKPIYANMLSLYRNKLDVFDAISTQFNVSKEELIMKYREHTPEIRPFDGVTEILTKIRALGGKTGIITDGRTVTQNNKIKALGITHLIDKVVISEDLGTEKPCEQNFRTMETALESTDYYYIADNPQKDFITPNLLGWKTIGLLDNGLNIHFDGHLFTDKKYMPHNFIASFRELNVI